MIKNDLFIEGYKLPDALSKKEIFELYNNLSNNKKETYKKLIEHNIKFVLYRVSKRFKTYNYCKQDLVQIGNIGLIKAVTTFNPARGISFITYATICIDNEILMFIRSLKKHQNIDSIDRTINYKDSNILNVSDIISDNIDIEKNYIDNETHQILRKEINNLQGRDKMVMILYFGFNTNKRYKQKEIADILNLSQSRVSRILKENIIKLRLKLEKLGIIEIGPILKKKL